MRPDAADPDRRDLVARRHALVPHDRGHGPDHVDAQRKLPGIRGEVARAEVHGSVLLERDDRRLPARVEVKVLAHHEQGIAPAAPAGAGGSEGADEGGLEQKKFLPGSHAGA
jgi:hypothetical protein